VGEHEQRSDARAPAQLTKSPAICGPVNSSGRKPAMHSITALSAENPVAATLKWLMRAGLPPRVSSRPRAASPPMPDGRIG